MAIFSNRSLHEIFAALQPKAPQRSSALRESRRRKDLSCPRVQCEVTQLQRAKFIVILNKWSEDSNYILLFHAIRDIPLNQKMFARSIRSYSAIECLRILDSFLLIFIQYE